MGQERNRDQAGASGKMRGRAKPAKVLVRPAPRGLPSVVAETAHPSPITHEDVDWRTIGDPTPTPSTANLTSADNAVGEGQRETLLAAMPELRGLLDSIGQGGSPAAASPAVVRDATPPAPSRPPSANGHGDSHDLRREDDIERELLARLGEAASETVRNSVPQSLTDSFVGDGIDTSGAMRRPGAGTGSPAAPLTRRSPAATNPAPTPAAVIETPPVPAAPATPSSTPAAAGTDTKRVKQVEAEAKALKSNLLVVERTVADLERSVQHQLSSLEERILTALSRFESRQPAASTAPVIDTDAIEARIIARLQPFDAATVEQRLSERIDTLDPETLEQRVADRLATINPEAVEERIVTRLQAGGVRSIVDDPEVSADVLAAMEERVLARLVETQTSQLDARLAEQIRALDPEAIEQRLVARVPSHDDLQQLESRVAGGGSSPIDMAQLEADLETYVTEQFDQRLAQLGAPAAVDADALEAVLLAKVEARLGELGNAQPAADIAAFEARMMETIESKLAQASPSSEQIDLGSLEAELLAKVEARLAELNAPAPEIDFAAFETKMLADIERRLGEVAEQQPTVDVDGIVAQVLAQVPGVDADAIVARAVAEVPAVDVDAIVARAVAEVPTVDIDAIVSRSVAETPAVDVEAIIAQTLARVPSVDVEAIVAQTLEQVPAVDADAIVARAVEQVPGIDVDAIVARAVAEVPAVDAEAIIAQAVAQVPATDFSSVESRLSELETGLGTVEASLSSKVELLEEEAAETERAVSERLAEADDAVAVLGTQLNQRVLDAATELATALLAAEGRQAATIAQLDERVTKQIDESHQRSAARDTSVDAALAQLDERVGKQLGEFQQRSAARDAHVDGRLAAHDQGFSDQADDMKLEISGLSAALLQQIDIATSKLSEADEEKMRNLETRIKNELEAVSKLNTEFEPIRERIGRIGLELGQANDERNHLKETLEKRMGTMEAAAELLEAKVIESSSVDIAVYLDRIAEIERAMSDLDPDRFALAEDLQALTERLKTPSLPPPPVQS